MTRRQRTQACLLLGLLAGTLRVLSEPTFGATRYVNQNAAGANNGANWVDAFTELQSALAVAVYGDEIWVAAGTYRPDYSISMGAHTGSRSASFYLPNGVGLYGGFAGDEIALSERNPAQNETVLTGDLLGNDDPNPTVIPWSDPSRQDNSYHVVTGSGTDTTAVLDGFMITGGAAIGDTPNDCGAGILIAAGSTTIRRCTLVGNAARWGGGMHISNDSRPLLSDCSFDDNLATNTYWGDASGGGIYSQDSSPTIENCILWTNVARNPNSGSGADGGGIYCERSTLVLRGCTFDANRAESGEGGALCNRLSTVDVAGCHFSANSAGYGGGLCIDGCPSVRLSDCRFTANNSGRGAAVYNSGSTLTIHSSVCDGNSATDSSYGGVVQFASDSAGAVESCTFTNNEEWSVFTTFSAPSIIGCTFASNGGAICNSYGNPLIIGCTVRNNGKGLRTVDGSPRVERCLFVNNGTVDQYGGPSGSGAGLFVYYGEPTLSHCAFVGNYAHEGGGMEVNDARVTVAGCTFLANIAQNGSAIWCYTGAHLTLTDSILWGNSATQVVLIGISTASTLTISYTDIQGGREEVQVGVGVQIGSECEVNWGEGNLNRDPGLTLDGHLQAGSPCIGAGDPLSEYTAALDIDGEMRVSPAGGRVDMGSDEFRDSDNDHLPDWWESKYCGSPTGAEPDADADRDGLTNLSEYEVYGSNPVGQVYYVNSVTGSDGYNGRAGTPGAGNAGPKRTIQAALDLGADGDTVCVAAGTYSGPGNVALDYRAHAIVLRGKGDELTIIDCGGASQVLATGSVRGAGAALEGFTIQNSYDGYYQGTVRVHESRLMLKNCTLRGLPPQWPGGGLYGQFSHFTLDTVTTFAAYAFPWGVSGCAINLRGPFSIGGPALIHIGSTCVYGSGHLELAAGTTLQIGDGNTSPVVIKSSIFGVGDITIPEGKELDIEDGAVVDLSGGAGGNCANGCVVTDPANWGMITVNGKLVVRGATVRNTSVQVTLAEFTGGVDIINNDIRLLETSTGYGGEFFVEGTSKIECNTIRSEGDRYLDLDPDPSIPPANRPTLCGNKIHVVIKEGVLGSQGTLLELRGLDYDSGGPNNPTGASGAFPAPGSPGFTADPSANWVLEELEILPGAKLNLTNRPGFEFQTGTTPLETVYVKNLILHENAVLNTALQTLYYENLVQHPTSRIVDEPLLGFSLGIIAMNDPAEPPHNEFDIRIRKRLRDPGDTQDCKCDGACPNNDPPKDATACKEGSIERLPEAQVQQEVPGLDTGGGVMDMRTQAPDRQSASSVAAKGAFARAGDEDIVVTFEYLFRQADANTKLIIYLSDKPDVGVDLIKVAELRPSPASLPGGTSSNRFATFVGRFPKGALNFTRGTYVELELRGQNARVWIDNFDPQVWCQGICANFDVNPGIDNGDYLILLAEGGRPLPSEKGCLDISGDGYVDLSDVLAWDVVYNTTLNLCPEEPANLANRAVLDAVERPKATDGGTGYNLLVAGKRGDDDSTDLLATVSGDGTCTGTGQTPACPSGDCTHGNARLVQDAAGTVYLVHGVYGLLRQDTGEAVVSPRGKTYQGSTVRVGVLTDEDIPLLDAAFAPGDMGPQYVYVLPVRVTAPDGHTYKAVTKLQLLGGGDYNVSALIGMDPAGDSDPCVNASTPLPGGRVLPLCDLSGMRELERDSFGNLFVASATEYNDNDWVLIYNEASGSPGFEAARVKLNTLFESEQFPVPAGPGALRFSTHFPNTLYLASMVNAANGLVTRVYRFAVQRSGNMATGLTFTGAVEIDSANAPPDICGQITCTDYVSGISSIQEAPDGTLYVMGFTAPKFAENDPLPVSEMFTTPTMGVIPWNATWSTVSATVTVIPAAKITSCDLALPLSAVLMMAPCNHPPSDLDGDTDVDGFDFLTFSNCYNGSNRPALPACASSYADLDRDCDVDGFDFLTFANCYNGSDRPPLCR